MTSPARRTRDQHDRGSVTLEVVILAPGILLLLAVILQAAWWYMARSAAHAAAAEGVRAARILGAPPGAGADAARRFAADVAAGQLRQVTADTSGSDATTVAVTVRAQAPTFLPGFDLGVSQTVRAPRERFTVPGER
ncbi:TadE/TadG family type IV pilus assembly protein [Actinomadura sp. SCN-SB]|uniref:TadE/TadG family type IV pilus assembly protein n=1 Tax=Actinomadura sp. SCN-SB TaxID=3373092 RepID=UPI00375051CC